MEFEAFGSRACLWMVGMSLDPGTDRDGDAGTAIEARRAMALMGPAPLLRATVCPFAGAYPGGERDLPERRISMHLSKPNAILWILACATALATTSLPALGQCQAAKLTVPDANALGSSVSFSGDYAVVGARRALLL